MKKFEQMKFPESFTSSDFAEERDPKKMSRVLSWLFQFFETLAPANDYAYNVNMSFFLTPKRFGIRTKKKLLMLHL